MSPVTTPEPESAPGPPPTSSAPAAPGPAPGPPSSALTRDGRDASRVPADWAELIDPDEWRLNDEGLPARRAARVIALRRRPVPAILLVVGHDFSAADRSWGFTPGGGVYARLVSLSSSRKVTMDLTFTLADLTATSACELRLYTELQERAQKQSAHPTPEKSERAREVGRRGRRGLPKGGVTGGG